MVFRFLRMLLLCLPAMAQLSFTTGSNGLTSLQYSGTEYNYPYPENLLTGIRPDTSVSYTVPGCTTSFTPSSVMKKCSGVSLTVTYTAVDTATLSVSFTIENTGSSPIGEALISTIGFLSADYRATESRTQRINHENPASYIDYRTGQVFLWNNTPSADSVLQLTCGYYGTICKNQVRVYSIDPSTSKTVSYSLRFVPYDPATAAPVPPPDAVPEAYEAFRAAYPFMISWTDHRPIMAWFISDYTKRGARNPRGYLQQPGLNVTDGTFSSGVMIEANKILGLMKGRPIQPQGLLVWDLEGQEFLQATTYIGDPRILAQGYAPEMDAVADQLFGLFKDAGYQVGVTLRPQYVQWGRVLPDTCHYDKSNDFKDYFIKLDGAFGEKFYSCYDPSEVKWSLIPEGNGGQTFYQSTDSAAVTALLMAKVDYAHSRWGATIFYVDTAVWSGGAALPAQVFRDLQTAYPDSLFIPEQGYIGTAAAAVEFQDPKNSSAAKYFPLTWSWAYPNGFLAMYLANCTGGCWTSNYDRLLHGQMIGDIAIYPQPTQISGSHLEKIEAMIQTANDAKAQAAATPLVKH